MNNDFFNKNPKDSDDIFDLDLSNVTFIPSLDENETHNQDSEQDFTFPSSVFILPSSDNVMFPLVMAPVTVTDPKTISKIEELRSNNSYVGVITQISPSEEPTISNLNKIGVIGIIDRIFKLPNGKATIVIDGKVRFSVVNWITETPFLFASISQKNEAYYDQTSERFKTIIDSLREKSIEFLKETFGENNVPPIVGTITKMQSGEMLINFVCSTINVSFQEKQKLLEIDSVEARALSVLKYLEAEIQKVKLRNEIQSKVRFEMDKQQRDYFLHQQIKTINQELGDQSPDSDFEELTTKANQKKWDDKVKAHFNKEFAKLKRTNSNFPDYGVQRNYIDLFLDLPWNEYTADNFDLKKSQKILDKDHFGLEEVKKRIVEYLAVLKLRGDMKSPILCLYGPPGVGKTSLGKSIASALGRKYGRISLGGLRDEAEIRGHRKTYIGAMPGRIIQLIKKLGSSNPVIVLDEIDKLGSRYDGDPSSALLEVLDPEQNNDFYDNFLEIGYDLSKVLFIATANDISTIHPALRDRMEMINIPGYTIEEKVEIAKKYLVKKQTQEHGLKEDDISFGKKEIEYIVEGYTRESGVRDLEKQIAKVVRSVAKNIATEEEYSPKISVEYINTVLGPARLERDKYENNDIAGVVTGLAWTSVGGEILFIESTISKGKGGLSITGNLGQVMKESATIALEYIKANSELFNIDSRIFDSYNIHIHIPEGATPKDGPSAGVTMLTSLVSLLTQKKVKKNLAMTGEITLRGKVLPVGGIKEKILAAKRAGIKELILCKDNEKDILEINQDYLKGLTFHYVTEMEEVVKLALTSQDVKNPKKLIINEN